MFGNVLLNQPFSSSTQKSQDEDGNYPIALNGVGYVVDTREEKGFLQRRYRVDYQQSESTEGESLLLPPDTWRRKRESWHYGTGQEFADRPDSIPFQFRDSHGIDPWDEWSFTLLKRSMSVVPFPSAFDTAKIVGLRKHLVVAMQATTGDPFIGIYHVDGSGLDTSNAHPGRVFKSLTHDGERAIYALDNGEVWTATPDPADPDLHTWTFERLLLAGLPVTLPGLDFVAFQKNRIIAGAANTLYDLTVPDENGDPYLIYKDANSTFRWVDSCDGPTAIYVLGGTDDKWVIQRLTISDDATVLNPPITTTELPGGEVGYSLAGYMGFVAVGSDDGIRFALTEPSGELALGQLIRTKAPVQAAVGWDRFIWYGNTAYSDSFTGLGRMDLSLFTDPLKPAYANDLFVPGQGVVSDADTVDGRIAMSVDGEGIYAAHDTEYVDEGWLDTGSFTFGTAESKRALTTAMQFFPLEGRINLNGVIDYDEEPLRLISWNLQNTTNTGQAQVPASVAFTHARLLVNLIPTDDKEAAPRVTMLENRSIPVVGNKTEWILPILLHDALDLSGAVVDRDVARDYLELVGLVQSALPFTLKIGTLSWQVRALDFEWRPMKQSRSDWNWQGTLLLNVREIL